MDYTSEFDNVKSEKAKAMVKYRRMRKVANMFRLFEIVLALILFSWLSTCLPSVVQISVHYLKKLSVVVVSPRFVFFIGNAIILTLFLNSGHFSKKEPKEKEENTNLYEEFVKSSETRQKIYAQEAKSPVQEIVYQDKQTVHEQIAVPPVAIHPASPPLTPKGGRRRDAQKKTYRRSKSESVKTVVEENPQKELRRSETETRQVLENSGKSIAELEMSNEEFQKTIEAFIAKQAKFHWEESMAIVVQNHHSWGREEVFLKKLKKRG